MKRKTAGRVSLVVIFLPPTAAHKVAGGEAVLREPPETEHHLCTPTGCHNTMPCAPPLAAMVVWATFTGGSSAPLHPRLPYAPPLVAMVMGKPTGGSARNIIRLNFVASRKKINATGQAKSSRR